MKPIQCQLTAMAMSFAAMGCLHGTALAESQIPPSLVTPDKVETRIGTLEFKDGAPSETTLEKVYDHLDFTHAFRAFADRIYAMVFLDLTDGPMVLEGPSRRIAPLLRPEPVASRQAA